MRTDIAIAIAANKCDMEESRKVPKETAREYAQSIDAFLFETSAKDDKGIEDLFLTISKKLIDKHTLKSQPVTPANSNAIDLDSNKKKKNRCCGA